MPKFNTFLLFIAVGLLSVIVFTPKTNLPSNYADAAPNYYTSVATATTLTVATSVTQVLATNTGRLTGQVINMGTSTVYCKMDGNTTAASSSVNTTSSFNVVLTPLGSSTLNNIQFGPSSLIGPYGGDLNCIASSPDLVSITDK